jgi:sugar lactone lactonase YvrE
VQTPDVLLTGIVFGVQPRWHGGRLWFSDWGTQEVTAVDPDGTGEVVYRGSSFPLWVDWLPDGRLLAVDTSTSRLLVQEADGSLEIYADLRQGSEVIAAFGPRDLTDPARDLEFVQVAVVSTSWRGVP